MQQEKNGYHDPHKSLEKRPGIIFVESPNVGKHTLLSRTDNCHNNKKSTVTVCEGSLQVVRFISINFDDTSNSTSQEVLLGWTINTKYYTADVSICIAHFHDGFSITALPTYTQLATLVMVFDVNDIGSKVDFVPGHPVDSKYRIHLLKAEDSFAESHLEFVDYGNSEIEGSSLLGGDEPSLEIRKSCLEWCTEHNIEFHYYKSWHIKENT